MDTPRPLADPDSLLPFTADFDAAPAPIARPAWELRLGLGAVLVAIVAAVSLVPMAQASAASARGETPAASEDGVAAVVKGLQVFTNGPLGSER